MSFSIRMTEEEKALAESYARMHSMSLAEAFKRALFEKIEDEYDLAVAERSYEEYKKDPVTYTLAEMEKMSDPE